MESIAPCRSQISDRFPIASFDIALPQPGYYEVACATDPRLFHTDWKQHRNSTNFCTSRYAGLLPAPDGRATYFVPPDQLRRFAGARRIYYALAAYGAPQGGPARFSISPDALDQIPSIAISPDFTGRTLDRARLGVRPPADDVYGSVAAGELRWGGDDLLESERKRAAPVSDEYDDGHSPDLWKSEQAREQTREPAAAQALADQDAYDQGIAAELSADSQESGNETGDYLEAPYYGSAFSGGDADDDDDEAEYGQAFAEDESVDREEDGYEDGVAYGAAYGAAAVTDGYEDAAALYGAVGYAADEGNVATLEPETPVEAESYSEASAAYELSTGRDPAYSEQLPEEEELPAGGVSRALATVALDIPEKVRVVRVVAVAESGRDGYSAINPDNEYRDPNHPAYQRYHIGLSWGLIQFTQRSGALGRVLSKIKEREDRAGSAIAAEHRFAQLFGPDHEELLRVTNASTEEARVAPVGGANLWDAVWTARFRAAGNVPHVQYAQNEVALTDYVDPNLRVAAWLDFCTPRALAMLVDRCIHMGNGGGISWIMRSCGPIQTQADREAALRALGHADLRAFQTAFGQGLAVDGQWGPRSHAALTSALRALGSRSPIQVPTRDALLQRLVDAARGRRFHRRLSALHQNRTDFTDDTLYALG